MPAQEYKFNVRHAMHVIIGLIIMFSGHFLPPLTKIVPMDAKLQAANIPLVDGMAQIAVSHMGMIICMTFFGVIYLWTFADTIWPGLIGILHLIFAGFAPAPKVFNMFIGNPMVAMIFFLLIFAGAIIYSGLANWIAKYIMTRDALAGKPWLFTLALMMTTWIVAFCDQTTATFLMWPVLYTVLEACGFKKGDKYAAIMTVYICMMALLSFASDPFKGGAFYLVSNLASLSSQAGSTAPALDILAYTGFGIVVSLVSIAVLFAMLKFVYRVDVSPLNNLDINVLKKDPLPPMNFTQKVVLFTFIGYALWLLLPSIIGKTTLVGGFLAKHHMAGALLTVVSISCLFWRGKPAVNIAVSGAHFPWRVFLLIAVAMFLGGIMTAPETRMSLYMEYTLRSLLGGLDYTMLSIAVAALGITLTNFCNSVVLGLMMTPVLIGVADAFGYAAGPTLACFIYAVLIAACTPAASPFAALLFGQTKYADTGAICKYAVISSAIVLGVVVVVGLPLARILF